MLHVTPPRPAQPAPLRSTPPHLPPHPALPTHSTLPVTPHITPSHTPPHPTPPHPLYHLILLQPRPTPAYLNLNPTPPQPNPAPSQPSPNLPQPSTTTAYPTPPIPFYSTHSSTDCSPQVALLISLSQQSANGDRSPNFRRVQHFKEVLLRKYLHRHYKYLHCPS